MEIHDSAHKHGIDHDAIVDALGHAITVVNLEPDVDPPKGLAIAPIRRATCWRWSGWSSPMSCGW